MLLLVDTHAFAHQIAHTPLCFTNELMLPDVFNRLSSDASLAQLLGVSQSISFDEFQEHCFTLAIKAQLGYLVSLAWLPVEMQPSLISVVFLGDSKYSAERGYWRSEYVKRPEIAVQFPVVKKRNETADEFEAKQQAYDKVFGAVADNTNEYTDDDVALLAPVYKGTRKPRTEDLKRIVSSVYDAVQNSAYPLLKTSGYEADDQAALMCRLNEKAGFYHDVLLLTVDSDWLGLVSDTVSWYCMHGYKPRLRSNVAQINDWLVNVKKSSPIEKPSDIWAEKVKKGDSADNLPKGTPIELFDLYNPPNEFKLWEQLNPTANAIEALASPLKKVQTNKGERVLDLLGLFPAIG